LSRLDPEKAKTPAEASRRKRRVRDAHATLMREALPYAPGRSLIVPNKAVREERWQVLMGS